MVSNITNYREFLECRAELRSQKSQVNTVCSANYFGLTIVQMVDDFLKSDSRNLVIIVNNIKELVKLQTFLEYNLPDINILPFKSNHFHGDSKYLEQRDITIERLEVYVSLGETKCVIIATAQSMIQKSLPLSKVRSSSIQIKVGQEIDPELLCHQLDSLSYYRKDKVFSKGEYAKRGSVVDVFSIGEKLPIRIEFLGDAVVSIRSFDTDSTSSNIEIGEIEVFPGIEYPRLVEQSVAQQKVHEKYIGRNINKWNRQQITDAVKSGLAFKEQYLVNQIFWDCSCSSLENFGATKIISAIDYAGIKEFADTEEEHLRKLFQKDQELGEITLDYLDYFESSDSFSEMFRNLVSVTLKSLNITSTESQLIQTMKNHLKNERSGLDKLVFLDEFAKNNDLAVVFQFNHEKSLKKLIYSIEGLKNIVLSEELSLNDALKDDLVIDRPSLNYGFFNLGDLVFDEYRNVVFVPDIFNLTMSGAEKRKKNLEQVLSLESFKGIKIDDYLVHVNFGIGKYKGLVTLENTGVKEDFITLEYHGNDKIYVPVDRIALIEKFQGIDDSYQPKVDKLRSASWENKKSRASKKIRDIADKLLKIHARRQLSKRERYGDKDSTYFEFENQFKYVETPDQLNAIEDVHHDLSNERPMDRLVCGDVGFGKTEVAIRAALRVILNGHQVMFIAPTTVLSHQHYVNIRLRFEEVGINVALINRFITAKQAKSILSDFSEGKIDLLIGTHRLLSKDIKPKKLGLFVIDEEQRFGVEHKEKVKELNSTVDILTLTATPIPRSLNLAILGLKDVSVITTAPMERLPIQTFYMEFNENVIKDAIEKELDRGGQVFFIHNRVESISEFANFVQTLVPSASVLVAHGQQRERELEKNIINFMEGKFNVLICTTIIESGVDMPNVNTILVNDADRFGLAQLYQLRGRVGRSNIQSHSYFFVNGMAAITKDAKQRLDILSTHNDLGMGFKIAQFDLELRGAGNILGSDQSGRINDIGYELYMNLLKDEVDRQRGASSQKSSYSQTELSLKIDARISEDFIESEQDRLKIYRDLFKVSTLDALAELEARISDNFGKLPENFRKLFVMAKIKIMGANLGIKQINHKKHLNFVFEAQNEGSIKSILNLCKKRNELSVTSDFRLKMLVENVKDDMMILDSIIEILTEISKGN